MTFIFIKQELLLFWALSEERYSGGEIPQELRESNTKERETSKVHKGRAAQMRSGTSNRSFPGAAARPESALQVLASAGCGSMGTTNVVTVVEMLIIKGWARGYQIL